VARRLPAGRSTGGPPVSGQRKEDLPAHGRRYNSARTVSPSRTDTCTVSAIVSLSFNSSSV
jgi:hypothetical protein